MTVARCPAPPQLLASDDCERAAQWLCAFDGELPAVGAPSPRAWLVLGLELAALQSTSPALANDARDRAGRRLAAFAGSVVDPDASGDRYIAALAFAAARRQPDAVARQWIVSASGGSGSDVRTSLARQLAGEPGEPLEAPRWDDAVERALLYDPAPAVAELTDLIEAFGVRELPADGRVRLAAAAAARGFAELRSSSSFALGLALLRVHAAHASDRIGTNYAIGYVRRQQRLDGSFGHLPQQSPEGGDIRLAFHLPRTVLALWTIHDAGAQTGFVRARIEDAERAR